MYILIKTHVDLAKTFVLIWLEWFVIVTYPNDNEWLDSNGYGYLDLKRFLLTTQSSNKIAVWLICRILEWASICTPTYNFLHELPYLAYFHPD
jgi:hypothetical protein